MNMKYLNKFNEHVYTKALATDSSKWADNYKSLLKHLKNQIESRHLKNFKDSDNIVSFSINDRKYKIDKKSKLFLYKKEKESEKEIELDLTSDQIQTIIKALKKPLTSPKAGDSTKRHPQGRKAYMESTRIKEEFFYGDDIYQCPRCDYKGPNSDFIKIN